MNRLAKNPYADLDYSAEEYLPAASLQIYNYIDQHLVDREDFSDVNRTSASPGCIRRRFHQSRGIKGRRMAPRSILNFMVGDVWEHVIKHLIKNACVGPGKLYSEVNFGKVTGTFTIQHKQFDIHEQLESKVKIGPLTITSHWDGAGRRNLDGMWELIEAKSAGNYGFRKFKKDGPTENLKQAHAIMMTELARAMNIRHTRFFYGRKSSGHPWDTVVAYDEAIAEIVRQEYLIVQGPNAPEAPHSLVREKKAGQFTGRLVAKSFPCGFCEYINTSYCHNGLKRMTEKDADGHRRTAWVLEGK